WEANRLLHMPKVYTFTTTVTLTGGTDDDYPIESTDGTEHFLLDIRASSRNYRKARFQLRFRRNVVLARMCTTTPHTNPDGQRINGPHFHSYHEGYDDRWAEQLAPFESTTAALSAFCDRINLPVPKIQGGIS